MLTTEEAELLHLAQQATPGQWRAGSVEKHHVFVECRDPQAIGTERVLLRMNRHYDQHVIDAKYIAAAGPERMQRLLADLARARANWQGSQGEADAMRDEIAGARRAVAEFQRSTQIHMEERDKAYVSGIDACIKRVKERQAHYELYRDGTAMKTHPATFAILDEVLVFLGALRERAP